jgi:hypothetical protein
MKKIKQIIIKLLVVFNLNADSSFDYKIRKNDVKALKCVRRCKPLRAEKRHMGVEKINIEECFERCLSEIPMTDQERQHRIGRFK